jgi:hypothetical protein
MQEKMYEFEQNKKNNLIFHGVLAEHPETSEGLVPNSFLLCSQCCSYAYVNYVEDEGEFLA